MSLAAARDAASVIILREPKPAEPFQVLLVCRQASLKFMGGAVVFPGGKLDAEDFYDDMLAHVNLPSLAPLDPTPARPWSPALMAGLYVAAIREVFEEVGLLWATPRQQGATVDSRNRRLDRQNLLQGRQTFLQMVAARDLLLDTAALHYYAHWITPSSEARRYDTRFFWALAPADQEAELDLKEASSMHWQTPSAALAGYRAGDHALSPPTFFMLERLQTASTLAALRATSTDSVQPVLPKLVQKSDETAAILPWHTDYDAVAGEGLAHRPLPGVPSSIFLRNGLWQTA